MSLQSEPTMAELRRETAGSPAETPPRAEATAGPEAAGGALARATGPMMVAVLALLAVALAAILLWVVFGGS